ncbi:hypothetical protein ACIQZO_04555 [Streptomyces sp. NPDC097617]|uniref:hypothetical protein n=1 Tax=Streptomyces sp. NPDC097617 TaxID=3366091 RepID=UPI0038051CA9
MSCCSSTRRDARSAPPGTAAPRTPDPDDLLTEGYPRSALGYAGWHLAEYEDAAGHFLARAVPRG